MEDPKFSSVHLGLYRDGFGIETFSKDHGTKEIVFRVKNGVVECYNEKCSREFILLAFSALLDRSIMKEP